MRVFTVAALFFATSQSFAQSPEASKLPMPVKDLVTALIGSFQDADVEVRVNSANALAAIGTPAVDPLVAVLADPRFDVRSMAAYSLGVMGAEAVPSVAALAKLLKDPDKEVRRNATQALSRILLAQRTPIPLATPILAAPAPVAPPPPSFPEPRP